MRRVFHSALFVTFVGVAGCSSDGTGGTGPDGGSATGGSGGSGNKGGATGSNGGATGNNGGTGGGIITLPPMGGTTGGGACGMASTSTSECSAQQYVGRNVPLDIYIMFDQSGSMLTKDDGTTTRMDAVRTAVDQFLKAPESAGISVGIGYFGHQPIGSTTCNPADYANASVTMGLLPGHAAAVMASLNAKEPTGETPTGAAIRGACSYAKGWKQANAGHQVAILLVTDGKPEAPRTMMAGGSCAPTLQDAQEAAAACHTAAPGVKTYVLGVGPMLENLNSIAQAGGTKSAYLVASGGTAEILKALHAIRGDATIPCSLQIPQPSSGMVDFTKVNVVHYDATCAKSTFVKVASAAACTGAPDGAWYYDDASKPTTINLCTATCDRVNKPGGQLNVTVGCATRIIE